MVLNSASVRLGNTIRCVFRNAILHIWSWKLQRWCLWWAAPTSRWYWLSLFAVDTIFSHRQMVIVAALLCSFFIMSKDTATTLTPPLMVVYSRASSITRTVMMAPLREPNSSFSSARCGSEEHKNFCWAHYCATEATSVPDAFKVHANCALVLCR